MVSLGIHGKIIRQYHCRGLLTLYDGQTCDCLVQTVQLADGKVIANCLFDENLDVVRKCLDRNDSVMSITGTTKKGIGKEIQEAGKQCIDADYVERFCNSISTVLDNLSFEEKKTVLREVVEKVIIKDSEISIYGIIPSQGELDDIEDVSIAYGSS